MFCLRRAQRAVIIAVSCSLLGACAASSVFNPYPRQAQAIKAAVVAQPGLPPGTPSALDKTIAELNEERDSADAMLYMMERGRLTQINNQFNESKQDFALVIDKFEAQDLASTVAVADLGAQGASMLTNDNALPYKGAGYERILTHHHQAFNYWGLNDFEGAAVEFRKAGLEQQILLEKHESELAEAHEEAEENDINLNTLSSEFAGLDTIAGKVKSSFQNAYTFYASALFWEAIGETNSALIDYKKALEINPDAEVIKQDIARVSQKLGIDSETIPKLPGKNQGSVVILFEEGFVPAKSEIKLPIPMLDGGIIAMAFPYYETANWPHSPPLRIVDDQFNDHGTTIPVVNVGALAVKDLKERIPELLVRQSLRAVTKYQLQSQTGQQSAMAGLVANIYNLVSESADRRSWLTLPNTGQVARMHLDAGERTLRLSTPTAEKSLTLAVEPERTTLVRVISVNNQLLSQVFRI